MLGIDLQQTHRKRRTPRNILACTHERAADAPAPVAAINRQIFQQPDALALPGIDRSKSDEPPIDEGAEERVSLVRQRCADRLRRPLLRAFDRPSIDSEKALNVCRCGVHLEYAARNWPSPGTTRFTHPAHVSYRCRSQPTKASAPRSRRSSRWRIALRFAR